MNNVDNIKAATKENVSVDVLKYLFYLLCSAAPHDYRRQLSEGYRSVHLTFGTPFFLCRFRLFSFAELAIGDVDKIPDKQVGEIGMRHHAQAEKQKAIELYISSGFSPAAVP